MLEVHQATVEMAGHSRLEQIRASMRGDALPAGGAAGTPAAAPGTPAAAPNAAPTEKPIGQQ
jgi:phage shock protein A